MEGPRRRSLSASSPRPVQFMDTGMAEKSRPARTRRELFSTIAKRLGDNQEILERTGKPSLKQLKVFWLEVNPTFRPAPPTERGWQQTDHQFYLHGGMGKDGSGVVWLDTSVDRTWYVYTFEEREETDRIIRTDLLSQRGVDRYWLAEPFLDRIQRDSGYSSRGFGFSFAGVLGGEDEADRPHLSAKFWLGIDVPEEHRKFLALAEKTFSKSSVRLGRKSKDPSFHGSGILMEVYSQGITTITTSEDVDETLSLVSTIGTRYTEELRKLEGERERFPRPVEFRFNTPIKLDRLRQLLESGVGGPGLWMQRYASDSGIHRYTGVDLHTHELLNLDVAEDYAYLVTSRKGCMNAAPRLMTISAEKMSGKTEMSYEGRPLFA